MVADHARPMLVPVLLTALASPQELTADAAFEVFDLALELSEQGAGAPWGAALAEGWRITRGERAGDWTAARE